MRWVNAMKDMPFLVYAWLSFPRLYFKLLEGRNLYYMINLKPPARRFSQASTKEDNKLKDDRNIIPAPGSCVIGETDLLQGHARIMWSSFDDQVIEQVRGTQLNLGLQGKH